MTVRDLLIKSFKTIHVLGAGEALGAEDATDALDLLNGVIEQANIDKLMSSYQANISFPLVANQNAYTIGPASSTPHVIATRPVEVLHAFSTRGGIDLPIFVGSKEDYSKITLKSTVTAGWETFLYYEPAFPKGTIFLYPNPADSLTTLTIVVNADIVTFATLNDQVLMPPGYRMYLQYKTAERLAVEYGFPFTDQMRMIMIDVESSLKRNNIKAMPVAGVEVAGLSNEGHYNIFSDNYGRN